VPVGVVGIIAAVSSVWQPGRRPHFLVAEAVRADLKRSAVIVKMVVLGGGLTKDMDCLVFLHDDSVPATFEFEYVVA